VIIQIGSAIMVDMNKFKVPAVPKEENTSLVKKLINLIDSLMTKVRSLTDEVNQLKDAINVLKEEKKRPKFKASKMDDLAGKKDKRDPNTEEKRPGSKKKSKTEEIKIHAEKTIKPDQDIPKGSLFKGHHMYTVQGLKIESYNTLYRLERWQTPDGKWLKGVLPDSVAGTHFSFELIAYILYQHYQCQVTQPLLLEQLLEYGVQISSGQINRILNEGKESFHDEKEDILHMGLRSSKYVTVDDTGTRHKGKNGYVTNISSEHFAWFESSNNKTRINFLELLNTGETSYIINEDSISLMINQKLGQTIIHQLICHPKQQFKHKKEWEAHLKCLGITKKRQCRIATESALYSGILQHDFMKNIVIVSDDAGQFNVLLHALCWVHTERLIHKLISTNESHRKTMEQVRDKIWTLYADLKQYKIFPTNTLKEAIISQFDTIFTQVTPFKILNSLLSRIYNNKDELLLVLQHPEIPLHTNASEGDIREYVKKMKISGGTRSTLGQKSRDTFASIKKTCRKLGISFWNYLLDRLSFSHNIQPLHFYIQQRSAPS